VEYVLQACEALVEAHAAGIVHRDLKPQNLFVTRRLNGTPLLKVLDFGIAKAIGPGAEGQMALTDSAAIIGSPLYMAPEQMRSARTAEVRSDIWALGVILYELLGGQLPFEGETVTEVCIRVVNEQPKALLELRPGLDPALIAIVMRCLEKEPEARYHNVSALAAALEPFSRSAQQGGPVRPWRSFEDTQDSGQKNPFAPGGSLASAADATGPSTAVTMETLPPVDDPAGNVSGERAEPSEDERRARALAGSTKASAGSGSGARKSPSERAQPLVSTDVTWGESSEGQAAGRTRPSRSFSTGMVAAIVAAVAVAAVVVGLVVGRGSTGPSDTGRAAASQAAAPSIMGAGGAGGSSSAAGADDAKAKAEARAKAEAEAKAEADAARAKAEAEAKNAAEARGGKAPSAVTPATSASGIAARLTSTSKLRGNAGKPVDPGAATAGGARPSVAAPDTAPRTPDTKPSDPATPNGAPILH
jgi:serine/threonine-protein kinase